MQETMWQFIKADSEIKLLHKVKWPFQDSRMNNEVFQNKRSKNADSEVTPMLVAY